MKKLSLILLILVSISSVAWSSDGYYTSDCLMVGGTCFPKVKVGMTKEEVFDLCAGFGTGIIPEAVHTSLGTQKVEVYEIGHYTYSIVSLRFVNGILENISY